MRQERTRRDGEPSASHQVLSQASAACILAAHLLVKQQSGRKSEEGDRGRKARDMCRRSQGGSILIAGSDEIGHYTDEDTVWQIDALRIE